MPRSLAAPAPPIGPFGRAIFLQGGAQGAMPDTVPAGLDTLAMGSDVDGDGITDIDEPKNGMNPNPGDNDLCPITYGCGARVAHERAPHSPVSGWGALAAAVAALVLVLRLQRRAPRRVTSRSAQAPP